MTNQLKIMLKDAAVEKSDTQSWHFPSGPQTTKNVSQATQSQTKIGIQTHCRRSRKKDIFKHSVASSKWQNTDHSQETFLHCEYQPHSIGQDVSLTMNTTVLRLTLNTAVL
jgi:hypothetical protein